MLRYKLIRNAQQEIEGIITYLHGPRLLNNSRLNKGSAFDAREREELGLLGRVPSAIETIEQQASRAYLQYQETKTDLLKNVYLNQMHDYNETLFYRLVSEHLEEMLPIIYTPTVGEAVQRYSLELRRPRGLYFSYPERAHMRRILQNRSNEDVDMVLVTDGEGVLGIGDQGVGAMDISIAKLMVYTLCAGINPNRYLPIQLDVGTNNESLLKDPMYMGWRHERIVGKDYDDFIESFIKALKAELPGVYLHWEDFGRENARKNLERYRDEITSFNDDMQGTGATALACVLSGMKAAKTEANEQRVVILGAGTAGCGIADQICDAFVRGGLSQEDAHRRFWLVDRHGLLVDDMSDLLPFQRPYARARGELGGWTIKDALNITLQEVVDTVKPTILIGCSTVHGAFTESVVRSMAAHVERPIVLPLSNPTHLSEADPKDLLAWTQGKALIATGSPFAPVSYQGKSRVIGQSNNAFLFPGLGLGVIATRAKKVSDNMLWVASDILSDASPARVDPEAALLPNLNETWDLSRRIAVAVAKEARREGLAGIEENADLEKSIDQMRWYPRYYPYYSMEEEGH